MPTDTPTVTETSTPSDTPVPSETPVPTQTGTPTSTPLPTLLPGEAKALIYELLQTNGGCELPCWWGLIPSETSFETTRSFLDTFRIISIANFYLEKGGYIHWKIPENNLLININANITYNRNEVDTLEWLNVGTWLERSTDQGFEIVYGDPLYKKVFQAYTLQSILATYGNPSEVLVYGNLGRQNILQLLLYYPELGFIAMFTTPLESEGDLLLGCMFEANTALYLWSPEYRYTWSEAVSITTGGGEDEWLKVPFLRLDEATSMSLDEFYTTFSDPNNTSCIETPASIWPGP
jgi:hypothetical protein